MWPLARGRRASLVHASLTQAIHHKVDSPSMPRGNSGRLGLSFMALGNFPRVLWGFQCSFSFVRKIFEPVMSGT